MVPGGPTDTPMVPDDGTMERSQLIRPEKMAPPTLHLASDAGGAFTGMRFVAANWDFSFRRRSRRRVGRAGRLARPCQEPGLAGRRPEALRALVKPE